MKKTKQLLKSSLSIVLVLAMLVGVFPANALLRADASSGEQDETKNVYNYIEDFSGVQGQNNWYYSSEDHVTYGKEDGTKFNNISEGSYWSLADDKGTKFTKSSFTFTGYNGSGIMFVAPKSGTIKIEQELSVTDVATGKVVKYSIYKLNADTENSGLVEDTDVLSSVYPEGTTKLGMNFNSATSTYKIYENNATDTINKEVEVEAGQRILFHAVSNGGAGPVVTFSKFQITYQVDAYDYKEGFSGVQGQNGWYYNPSGILTEDASFTTTYYEQEQVWAAKNANGQKRLTEFGKNSVSITNTNLSSVIFEVPQTGSVQIQQSFTVTKPSGSTASHWLKYGVYVVDANNNVLRTAFPSNTKTGLAMSGSDSAYNVYYYNSTESITVDVAEHLEAGQKLYFVFLSNKSGAKLSINDFKITYTDDVSGGSGIKGTYNYLEDFSNVQGQDNWYYSPGYNNNFSANSGAQYNVTNESSYWSSTSGGGTRLGKQQFTMTGTNGAGVMFVAPKDGKIQIEQSLNVSGFPTGGVVKYGIYKAGEISDNQSLDAAVTLANSDLLEYVYPKSTLGLDLGFTNNVSSYKVYDSNIATDVINENVEVKQGDRIIFRLQSNKSGNPVITFDTFKITYLDQEQGGYIPDPNKKVYDYTKDFSGTQGQDNWYYNPAQTGFEGNTFSNDTWSNSAKNAGIFGKDKLISPKGGSWGTIAFKAPLSGSVRIEQKFSVSGGEDGKVLKYGIKKCSESQTQGLDGTLLYPEEMTKFMVNGTKNFNGVVTNAADIIDFTVEIEAGEYLVFGLLSTANTAYEVNLEQFTITYLDKKTFDYTKDFSGTQGQDNWYYNPAQTGFEGNTFVNDTWTNDAKNAGIFGKDVLISPKGGSWGTIAFKAPQSGWVRVEQSLSVSGGVDGKVLKYGIKKCSESQTQGLDGTLLYPVEMTKFMVNGTKNFDGAVTNATDNIDFTVQIEAGEYLVFGLLSTANTAYEVELEKFTITYLDEQPNELPSYQHTTDFSKTQQGPVWYYMSAEVGKNYFKELDHYNTTKQRWQTALEETYITGAIGDHYLAPWVSHDATLAFKAPFTGTIELKVSNAYVYSKSNDGVKLSIQKGQEGFATENIYPSGDLTTWKDVKPGDAKLSVKQTVDVRKGEWIYFRVNANVTYTGDNFYVNPSIQYLSVDESDEGIKALPDSSYIEEKEHTVPGQNMDITAFPMTGRAYSGSYTDITATEFINKLKAGELATGGYNITDKALTFDNTFSGKEVSASGIFVKASKGVKLDEVEGLRIKELTVEVTGDTDALITTNSIRDVRLLGWQVSYSGSDSDVELVKTTGTASAGTKADLVIDGLRFAGNGTVKGIKFTDAVHYATVKNSYITDVKDYAVMDAGSSTEGIYVGNCYIEGDIDINKESGVVRNNTIKGNVDIAEDFGMAAMNDITGNITAKAAQSVFLVKNKVNGKMAIEHGKACAILENEATEITVTGGEKCIVEDNNGAGKNNKPVASVKVDKDGTDHYGSNVYDQSVRSAVGVNEDLLPKNDNTLFVGKERKAYVNDGGNIKTVSEYILQNAKNDADVLLAPGAYSINGIKMTGKENLDLYFYCSLFEAATSRVSYFNFMFTNSEYSSIRGMTAGYAEPALGQGTIVEVTNNYFVVESHPGYYPDLTINDYYIDNFYCLTYREGSTTPSGYQNYGGKREYLGDGKTKFELTEQLEDVKVGDTFACRVKGNRYMQYWDNTECLMEDVTAYVSVEAFAGDERGNKNYYNRPAAIPGFGYEVHETDAKFAYWKSKGWITEYEGKYYGPEAIWCVSNFMNANENTVGPQVTNYRANQRHDDAFNIHGVYCAVTDFDSATKTLTYDNSASNFGTWMRNIQVGDKLFIYFPATGEILCETTATSATVDHGTYRTVQLSDSFENRLGAIIINNSAIGNGFTYDNCELKMSYPRGGIIKAGGTFKHCTFENIGKAAIMASPEIVDTTFCESGYVNGLNLLYNDIKNTNLMHALADKNSSISIYGHSENIESGYAKHRDITIQGNRFENWGAHAIYIDSAENVKILDNIFVDEAAYGDERTPIYLAGSKNVEVSGNKFPSQYSGKEAVQIGGVNVKNVYGQDVGTVKCIADYVKIDSRSVYASGKWMIMIAVTNVSDSNISIGLDKIRCSLVETASRQADNVAPGETAKFYFPLKDMKEIPATANFVYDLMINNDPELKLKNAKAEHVVFNIMPTGQLDEERWQTVVNESAGIEYDFNFWYDDENLYLKVIAKDDVHYQAESELKRIFYDDSIEFSIDPGRAKGDGAEGWSHYGVALNNDGEVLKYRWENTLSSEDVNLMDAVVTRDEAAKTTTYDIKVPWKLTGVNGEAPEEGDIVGLSICVDDVDSASDEREYMKWYDIKSISNQAGFYIQKTAIKAYNISVGNNNVSVSTSVALQGDKVFVTYKETAEMGLENWIINTENVVLSGNYATITVGDKDIVVNVSESLKQQVTEQTDKKPTVNKKEEPSEEASGIVSIARVIKIAKEQLEEAGTNASTWLKDYYNLLLRFGILNAVTAALIIITSSVLLFMLMRKKKRSSAEAK